MDKPIKIRNDETGDEGECMPSALPVWEAHGWTAVEDGSSEELQVEQRALPPQSSRSQVQVQPDPNKSKE